MYAGGSGAKREGQTLRSVIRRAAIAQSAPLLGAFTSGRMDIGLRGKVEDGLGEMPDDVIDHIFDRDDALRASLAVHQGDMAVAPHRHAVEGKRDGVLDVEGLRIRSHDALDLDRAWV